MLPMNVFGAHRPASPGRSVPVLTSRSGADGSNDQDTTINMDLWRFVEQDLSTNNRLGMQVNLTSGKVRRLANYDVTAQFAELQAAAVAYAAVAGTASVGFSMPALFSSEAEATSPGGIILDTVKDNGDITAVIEAVVSGTSVTAEALNALVLALANVQSVVTTVTAQLSSLRAELARLSRMRTLADEIAALERLILAIEALAGLGDDLSAAVLASGSTADGVSWQIVNVFPYSSGVGFFLARFLPDGFDGNRSNARGDAPGGILTLEYLGNGGGFTIPGTTPDIIVPSQSGGRVPSRYPGLSPITNQQNVIISAGQASIPLTFVVDVEASANMTLRFMFNDELVYNAPVSSILGGGLRWSAGNVIQFHSSVALNEIRVSEGRNGDLNSVTHLELTLPRYYKWHIGTVSNTGDLRTRFRSARGSFNNLGTTAITLTTGDFAITNPSDDRLRERIVITLPNLNDRLTAGPLATVADAVILENLWIVAEDRAPMGRDVDIDVRALNAAGDRVGDAATLTVAKRTNVGLSFSVTGDPTEVRSGSLGGDKENAVGKSTRWSDWHGGVDAERTVIVDVPAALDDAGSKLYYRGVQTQTVLLKEEMPNAWATSFGTATEFMFDDPGVRIVGAQVWLNYAEDGTSDTWGSRAFWAWQGWMNATNGLYPTNVNSVSLSADRLRIFFPSQNVTDVRKTRELRVTFFLSIEAGYEWKSERDNRSNDIVVTVKGTGVGNLEGSSASAVVATALDPIRVTHDGVVQVETNSAYFTGKTKIGDIHITENPDMRLEVQDEIWVYVIGDGRRQDVTFTADDLAIVEDAERVGLRLRRGYRLHHPQPNFWLDGMVYVIERESWSEEPATITITGGEISGNIYPDVDYKIVISGPGVAQNDQYVLAAQGAQGPAAGGGLAALTIGAFYKDPYTIDAVTLATTDTSPGTGTDTTPGTDSGSGTVIINPTLTTLPTLFTNQPTPGGVENPLIFRRNTTNTTDVGFVSVAAFLDLLRAVYGVDSVPTNDAAWDNSTQTATIYGPHKQGFTVTVVLTVGSTNVTINGVTMDIADSVGLASGPSGTIRVINEGNRNYLPLRCLAQAFGWVPTLEGNAVTFR